MHKILFLDPDQLLEYHGIDFVVNPPRREPVCFPQRQAWDLVMRGLYLEVMEEKGKYRMWYGCRSGKGHADKHTAYAESSDGISWQCPHLNVTECAGSSANNLINAPGLEASIFIDPRASAQCRYCGIWNVFGQGLFRFTSADGYDWRRDDEPLIKCEFDSQNTCFYDRRLNRYVGYVRMWKNGLPSVRRRSVGRWEAARIDRPLNITAVTSHPDPNRLPHLTEELPVVMACDEQDKPESDVYTNAVIQDSEDPNYYLAFPVIYTHFPETDDGPYRNAGTCETHFFGSSDGIHWHRYDRTAYAAPQKNEHMLYMGRGLIERDRECWQYAVAYRTHHGALDERLQHGDGEIVRFVQRRDGFVAAQAKDGWLRTQAVNLNPARLSINAETEANGYVQLRLRRIAGAGQMELDSTPIRGNDVRLPVVWQSGNEVEPMAVGPWIVECHIYRARCFAINLGV